MNSVNYIILNINYFYKFIMLKRQIFVIPSLINIIVLKNDTTKLHRNTETDPNTYIFTQSHIGNTLKNKKKERKERNHCI